MLRNSIIFHEKLCKICLLQSGELRLAKLNPNNPFGSGPMKSWYHVDCFLGMKKTKNSKTINSTDDVEGWEILSAEDKKELLGKLGSDVKVETKAAAKTSGSNRDNSFSEFQRIAGMVGEESSYKSKSQIIQKFLLEVRPSFVLPTAEVNKSILHLGHINQVQGRSGAVVANADGQGRRKANLQPSKQANRQIVLESLQAEPHRHAR